MFPDWFRTVVLLATVSRALAGTEEPTLPSAAAALTDQTCHVAPVEEDTSTSLT